MKRKIEQGRRGNSVALAARPAREILANGGGRQKTSCAVATASGLRLTDAEKAKAVWKAAFPRAHVAPSPELFEALAADLERAAAWAKMAREPRPADERKNLRKIEGAARKLAEHLAAFSETHNRLEHDWPNGNPDMDLPHVMQGVEALQQAAASAASHRRGAAVLEDMFGSPGRLFVRRCASAYTKHVGKNPGIGRPDVNKPNEIGGPFVRFTQEAARQFAIDVPDGETVRRGLVDFRSGNRVA